MKMIVEQIRTVDKGRLRNSQNSCNICSIYISGKEFQMLGLVKGSTIQSKNVGRDITQGFKTLVGGELKAYNEMI